MASGAYNGSKRHTREISGIQNVTSNHKPPPHFEQNGYRPPDVNVPQYELNGYPNFQQPNSPEMNP